MQKENNTINKDLPMPPKAEIKYYSFEKPNGKIDCDKCLSITASIITMSCIIGYFIYLSIK